MKLLEKLIEFDLNQLRLFCPNTIILIKLRFEKEAEVHTEQFQSVFWCVTKIVHEVLYTPARPHARTCPSAEMVILIRKNVTELGNLTRTQQIGWEKWNKPECALAEKNWGGNSNIRPAATRRRLQIGDLVWFYVESNSDRVCELNSQILSLQLQGLMVMHLTKEKHSSSIQFLVMIFLSNCWADWWKSKCCYQVLGGR